MERIVEIITGPEAENLRLDIFLAKRFPYHSRSGWQQAIRDGEILVDGREGKASHSLKAGEKIAYVPGNPLTEPEVDPTFRILSETEHYIAVEKSGNLPCHPSGIFFRNTLWYLLRERLGRDVHIITRLDRETSGVVLAALDSETASRMTSDMMAGRISKRYLAVVRGRFDKPVKADGFLSPDPDSKVRKKRRFTFEPEPDCETASTLLLPAGFDGTHSLVEALPMTGRLHQIRATLCSLGFPLAGDKLYGPDETFFLRFIEDRLTDSDRMNLILPGQALHAESLEWNGHHFSSPVPMLWRKTFPALFSGEDQARR